MLGVNCKGLALLLAVLWVFGVAQGQRQEVTSVRLAKGEGWSDPKAQDQLNLGLGFSSANYFQNHTKFFPKRGTRSQISDLTLNWSYSWHGVLDGSIDLKNRFAIQEKANYLMPKNVYAGRQGQAWDLWVGRKWYKWSEADEHLGRGLYQGRFMNDKLRKDSHGLTGFFVENKWRGGSWLLFASPLFVPEFGPDHELIDGDFYSPSPYFRPPSSDIDFLGVNTRMRYKVVKPAESDVALNKSFGTRLEHNWGHWFARGSYAYKPMNQLLVAGQFLFQHTEVGPQDIRVNVHPRVQYHHLSTLEGGWQQKGGWNSWLSYTYERPEQDPIPFEWVHQMTGKSGVATAYVGYDIFAGPNEVTRLYGSYSRVDGGDRPDDGELKAHDTLFERRFQFVESLELGLTGGHLLLKGKSLSWGARAFYDFVQQGGLLLADASWSWNTQWQVWGSVDVMGILDNERAEIQDGFLGEYRANDRVQLGVNYVF